VKDEVALTPAKLALELGEDPKSIRRWLRAQGWRPEVEKGQHWYLSNAQAQSARERFTVRRDVSPSPFDARQWNVGELLRTYSAILRELRRRNLVRTNNAPVGDLAEYACAIVYQGTLAPNSEKSYDLTAGDGRRIQVKVRNLRDDTRASSAFSPIRSFEFDVCAFLLIDEARSRVDAAFEWSVDEVRQHGVHRIHTNGTVVRVRQVRSAQVGLDITKSVQFAWQSMLALME
jgi:hypothetical protein